MTLTEILEKLLKQHASLRRLIEEVREAAARVPGSREELGPPLRALGDAVDAHNALEEELLGDVLLTIDAWGPVRAAKMNEQHREEHRRLRDAVRAAAEADDFAAAVRAALPAMDELLEHMRVEEAEQLNSDVLRDDTIVVDQTDG